MSGQKKKAGAKSLGQLADLIAKAGIRLKEEGRPRKDSKESAPGRRQKSELTDEEMFRKAMRGVESASWRSDPHPKPEPDLTVEDDSDLEGYKLMRAAIEGGFPISIPDHPEYIEGWIGVAGKRFLPKLRNGIYSIQGQIDLHGYGRAEAEIAVADFIIRMSRLRSCCIKIIHGRGINSPTEDATLKSSLQRLLATRRMSRYVVAYASAPYRDGGVGAVYVLLRTPR
jgi:DNA-nicking Smr family endonuclease